MKRPKSVGKPMSTVRYEVRTFQNEASNARFMRLKNSSSVKVCVWPVGSSPGAGAAGASHFSLRRMRAVRKKMISRPCQAPP
jgi:hypothetical protein